MTKFNRNEWKNDKDWQRVLTMWGGKFTRTGLTLHAISAICGRPHKTILYEMLTSPNPPYLQTCLQIKAPVFIWQRRRARVYPTWLYTGPSKFLSEWCFSQGMIGRESLAQVRKLCRKFPPSKYIGIRNWEGQTEFDMSATTVRQLKACAKGEISPFRRGANP